MFQIYTIYNEAAHGRSRPRHGGHRPRSAPRAGCSGPAQQSQPGRHPYIKPITSDQNTTNTVADPVGATNARQVSVSRPSAHGYRHHSNTNFSQDSTAEQSPRADDLTEAGPAATDDPLAVSEDGTNQPSGAPASQRAEALPPPATPQVSPPLRTSRPRPRYSRFDTRRPKGEPTY